MPLWVSFVLLDFFVWRSVFKKMSSASLSSSLSSSAISSSSSSNRDQARSPSPSKELSNSEKAEILEAKLKEVMFVSFFLLICFSVLLSFLLSPSHVFVFRKKPLRLHAVSGSCAGAGSSLLLFLFFVLFSSFRLLIRFLLLFFLQVIFMHIEMLVDESLLVSLY